ncbi:Rrf2 family transcriptional regulator [Chitinophaga sp. SYP-B3965]|uniref:RrF2 family transcriptional regulator n=1 Tax=Chitinophaga sp. SYP-B3965 TaxID=2663120 RepID=UPI001299E3B7|nr:Rrf2 family transcriptional regulator [Chitinophaga sp. SYP-B3965]MRG48638.1 Rrf2 family transcriptional regulator [Chitinophaga sp. SYP-B3965]
MLSKKTQYAFHALIYLAENVDKGPILISEIASEKSISIKFLENILLELKNAGILGSKKGKGGGYYLMRTPKEIPLARIIRLLDGPIALLPCVSLNYYERCDNCKDEAVCGLNEVMGKVRDATLKLLEKQSLKDILTRDN